MTFHSILFNKTEDVFKREVLGSEAPSFFADLNLDQIIDVITSDKEEYNLKPFFYAPLEHIDDIKYRYEIMQDLENTPLLEHIKSFSENMRAMRKLLSQSDKLFYKYQKKWFFLDVVDTYCKITNSLENYLSRANVKSRGFLMFREYLMNYVQSEQFISLFEETKKIKTELSSIRYLLYIKDLCVQVLPYESKIDYSAEVEKSFAKFKQGAVKNYKFEFSFNPMDMNHVEAQILDGVVQLYPNIFLHLDSFCEQNRNFLDEKITVFDREIQFYIAYLEYITILKQSGLQFCYPEVSTQEKIAYNYEGFDLALAYKLINEKLSVVTNDFYLKGKERIIVVTGPNQGGKTTFARTFGQLHYLANIGCPVPGKKAQLFLFDKLFTHFEKEENIKDDRGKLEDDLVRVHDILCQSKSNTIIIMNEILTSTTLHDALFLSKKVMEKIIELDLLCVWVTFIDELASLDGKTVSMVSTVVPENPSLRTFKIVRKPPGGLAYAFSIAEKYRLTYDYLKERIIS